MFARDFRERASLKMKGKGSEAALVYLVFTLIISLVSGLTAGIGIFLLGPFLLGFFMVIVEIGKGNNPNISTLFEGFKNFVNAILLYLLYGLLVWLWSLLFLIPGIIKSYAYSMSWYIMIDNPQLNANEAITLSKKMMRGNKWRLFCLHFSYIGWIFLGILSFGIYFFWLVPKMELANYEFYLDLKTRVNTNS